MIFSKMKKSESYTIPTSLNLITRPSFQETTKKPQVIPAAPQLMMILMLIIQIATIISGNEGSLVMSGIG